VSVRVPRVHRGESFKPLGRGNKLRWPRYAGTFKLGFHARRNLAQFAAAGHYLIDGRLPTYLVFTGVLNKLCGETIEAFLFFLRSVLNESDRIAKVDRHVQLSLPLNLFCALLAAVEKRQRLRCGFEYPRVVRFQRARLSQLAVFSEVIHAQQRFQVGAAFHFGPTRLRQVVKKPFSLRGQIGIQCSRIQQLLRLDRAAGVDHSLHRRFG